MRKRIGEEHRKHESEEEGRRMSRALLKLTPMWSFLPPNPKAMLWIGRKKENELKRSLYGTHRLETSRIPNSFKLRMIDRTYCVPVFFIKFYYTNEFNIYHVYAAVR